jgi:hypothetical protein
MNLAITSGCEYLQNGWGAFIFMTCIAIIGFALSVHWKLKLERLGIYR